MTMLRPTKVFFTTGAGKHREMFYTWKKEHPIKINHAAKCAEVENEGDWTTVIAAAVFIM